MRLRMHVRRRRGENGAVAVEAALVLPLVMLLVFGIIEFSLLLRDYVSVTSSARAGIRLASAEAGSGPCTSDATDTTLCTAPTSTPELAQDTADAVDRALTSVDRTAVQYLLVYEANAKGYPCTTATGCSTATAVPASSQFTCTGYINCVTFTWNATKGAFRYTSGAWDSRTISACVNAQDSVGIYLRTDHKLVTGLFGSKLPVNDRSVAKFEPLSDDSCDSTKTAPHP